MKTSRFSDTQIIAIVEVSGFSQTAPIVTMRQSGVLNEIERWTDPTTVDIFCPHDEACSKASGLTPPRWLWRRTLL